MSKKIIAISAAAAAVIISAGVWAGYSVLSKAPQTSGEPAGEHYANPAPTAEQSAVDKVKFSHEGYFYNGAIEVELSSTDGGIIRYTTDGSVPTEKSKEYKKALKLKSSKQSAAATVIKARVFYDDGSMSDTYVHTYFCGSDIEKRFNMPVISVSTDPDVLFDYEKGIWVAGKERDDYIKEHPKEKIDPPAPANYNWRGRESERAVYVEVFEPDGTNVLSQLAGLRTHGGWSRDRAQKSFKLYARKEYEPEKKKLEYSFFPDLTGADGYSVIDEFKHIVVRNCGNDNEFAFIRDEYAQRLCEMAGFPDTQQTRAAAVFVNGKYYGMYWLHEVYDSEYFENHYGKRSGEFQVLSGAEAEKDEDEDYPGVEIDYNNMYNEFSAADLTDDSVYEKLTKQLDVENYIKYCVLESYMNNNDWPNNNYKVYRYYAPDGIYEENSAFDGRWRFLLYDMDWTSGLYSPDDCDSDPFDKYMSDNSEEGRRLVLLENLLKRDDCRKFFIEYATAAANTGFGPQNAEKVLDEMDASRHDELERSLEEAKRLITEWASMDSVMGNMYGMKEWMKIRPEYYMAYLSAQFGMGDFYKADINLCKNGDVTINGVSMPCQLLGGTFPDCDTVINCIPNDGYEFDYWLVNDKKVTTQSLTINREMYTADDELVLVPFVKKSGEADKSILITAVSYGTDRDYIVLTNNSGEKIDLAGMTLSDDKDSTIGFTLPSCTLAPEQSVTIGCKGFTGPLESGIITDFSLKKGETLWLRNSGGEDIDVKSLSVS